MLILQMMRNALYTYMEYLYESPVAAARAVEIAKRRRRGEDLRPLAGERRLRSSAGEPRNVRGRWKEQHAAVYDLKAQRRIDPADAPEGVERFCAEAGAALRRFRVS